MTDERFAAAAKAETSSADNVVGKGRPVWNNYAIQFMYPPVFRFPHIPCYRRYRYTAVDENGKAHVFEADSSASDLSPVWADVPEGVVRLTVNGVDDDGKVGETVGVRTFFRLSPFTSDLAPAKRSYTDAAKAAFRHVLRQPYIRHWLTDGTPDPDYDLYVYPSKMISSIIEAMIFCARTSPENADEAMRIAKNAADYLISVTPKSGAMKDVPPTFKTDFRPDDEKNCNYTADDRINWVMMLYPTHVGHAYAELYKATGDDKYLAEAEKIGRHYEANVLTNGSWHLIKDIRTGEVLSDAYCSPLERIVPFLMSLFEITGDEKWKSLADGGIAFVEKNELAAYEWGGQFEDSVCSENYSNLSHYGPSSLIRHYAEYCPDDAEKMAVAEDLMRFVEDQFVVWRRPAPWNKDSSDTSAFRTPCGLEQYNWYVPIDASTASVALTFFAMYKAGRGEIYLEKAKALADSITNAQRDDGLIPTHWMTREMTDLPFWINCMLESAACLAFLGEALKD